MFSGFIDEFDLNIGGGVYFYFGVLGENGGVDIVINVMIVFDNLFGIFMANNNIFIFLEE